MIFSHRKPMHYFFVNSTMQFWLLVKAFTYKVYFKAQQKGLLSQIFQISSKTLNHFTIRCCVLSGLEGAFTLNAICEIQITLGKAVYWGSYFSDFLYVTEITPSNKFYVETQYINKVEQMELNLVHTSFLASQSKSMWPPEAPVWNLNDSWEQIWKYEVRKVYKNKVT